jgi:hypothetical protein
MLMVGELRAKSQMGILLGDFIHALKGAARRIIMPIWVA